MKISAAVDLAFFIDGLTCDTPGVVEPDTLDDQGVGVALFLCHIPSVRLLWANKRLSSL